MHAEKLSAATPPPTRLHAVRRLRLLRLLRVIGLLGLLLVLVGYLVGCASDPDPREPISPTCRDTPAKDAGDREPANQGGSVIDPPRVSFLCVKCTTDDGMGVLSRRVGVGD